MCEFCGTPEEQQNAKNEAIRTSEDLHNLADNYRLLALGKIKPHSEEMKRIGLIARAVIRNLVTEWI